MGSGRKRRELRGRLGIQEEDGKTRGQREVSPAYVAIGEVRRTEGPRKRCPVLRDRRGTRILGQ